ncbi:hypothetical protein ANCDUO_15223, partial [Ancylostoma duodenale]
NTFSRTNLNIEVVRRGYARVPPPESPRHLKALQTIPAYSRLVSRLLMSEKVVVSINMLPRILRVSNDSFSN